MNICYVTEHYPPHIGGVEKVFQEYATRLSKLGHKVRVITSNSGGINGTQNDGEITIHYIKCISLFGHPILPVNALEPHIKWADIVHTTTYTAALPAYKVAKKYKIPCLLTVHEVLGMRWFRVESNPIFSIAFFLFERFVIKKNYSHWHAISKATKNDLIRLGIPEKDITLIYHGIDDIWDSNTSTKDLHTILDFPSDKKIFLYNGRPGKTKGVFLLLNTIRSIKHEIPTDFVFGFILSRSPLKNRLKFDQLINQYGLGDLVHTHDSLSYSELPGYRKAAFAFIVPSLTEGFGFSAAETSALRVPIITSDAGALPEVVSGKALFFQSGNASDLSQKILLACQEKFDYIAPKKFDWQKTTNNLERLYIKLIHA